MLIIRELRQGGGVIWEPCTICSISFVSIKSFYEIKPTDKKKINITNLYSNVPFLEPLQIKPVACCSFQCLKEGHRGTLPTSFSDVNRISNYDKTPYKTGHFEKVFKLLNQLSTCQFLHLGVNI